MILVAVAAFLFLAVGPRFLGYQTSTMLTGSMAPLINPGDVVVSAAKPSSELKTGDIITYGIPVDDRRIETHRVVEIIRNANGTTAVRTKGDANNGADPWTAILQEDTVHVHAATIPYLGTAIRTLRDPIVLKILMYGAPAVLVTMLLASIWGKKPEATDASSTDAGNDRSA
ncbi:S26 family signal peptidase [Arthrobacter sp. Soil736]|nr:S26 family signal peptidase [Arthrobacter sp. Soil736]